MENSQNKNFISVGNAWNILKRFWPVIVICGIIGMVIATIISFIFITPKYSASTDILVNQKVDNSSVQYTVQQADLQAINTYKDILKKPIILDSALKDLEKRDNYNGGLSGLEKSVSISNSTNSQIVTVTAVDNNAYVAADMANIIAKVFKGKIKTIMKVDNVTIVSKATVDTKPISPNKKLNILLGLLAGIFLGTLISGIRELLDTTVKGTKYLTEELGLVTLGMIYHVNSQNKQGYHVVEIVEDDSSKDGSNRRV